MNEAVPLRYYFLRIGAQLIDLGIVFLMFFLVGTAVATRTGGLTPTGFEVTGVPALYILGIVSLAALLYFWVLEGAFGATLGKAICNLRVRRATGNPCGFGPSLVRNLLRPVDYFPFFLFGLIAVLKTARQQRLGDLAAKTVVVPQPSKKAQITGLALFLLCGAALIWGSFALREAIPLAIDEFHFTEGEAGPPMEKTYRPGGELHLIFLLSGVRRDQAGLANTAVVFNALDPQGKLILKPVHLEIKDTKAQGGPQVPVKFHLTLPQYAGNGAHSIQIEVEDRLANKTLKQAISYQVEGPKLSPNAPFGIQDYQFRSQDGAANAAAAYPPGSKVESTFLVRGFKLGEENRAKLRLDMSVFSAQGEKLLDQPGLLEVDNPFFYPPAYLPLNTSLNTPSSIAPGNYRIHYVLQDIVGKQTVEWDQGFTIRN